MKQIDKRIPPATNNQTNNNHHRKSFPLPFHRRPVDITIRNEERQQQGIEIAKRQGKYKGKIREYGPHSPNRQKRYIYKEACRLLNRKKDGDETLTKRQIARMLGIAPVTLYRIEKYQAEDLANVPRSER